VRDFDVNLLNSLNIIRVIDSAGLGSLCKRKLLGVSVNSVDVEEKLFIVPRINLEKLELDSH
jgi:hypothetical protein